MSQGQNWGQTPGQPPAAAPAQGFVQQSPAAKVLFVTVCFQCVAMYYIVVAVFSSVLQWQCAAHMHVRARTRTHTHTHVLSLSHTHRPSTTQQRHN